MLFAYKNRKTIRKIEKDFTAKKVDGMESFLTNFLREITPEFSEVKDNTQSTKN